MASELPVVRIAPNNPVFDLPVMVGIEEKLFEKAGLNVQMTGKWSDFIASTTARSAGASPGVHGAPDV